MNPTTVEELIAILKKYPPETEVYDSWDEKPVGIDEAEYGDELVLFTYGKRDDG